MGCLITGLASIACCFPVNLEWVLVCRFFQGFASGSGLIVIRALYRELYVGSYLSRMMAWILTAIPFFAATAPFIGELLVQSFRTWRAPFYLLFVYSFLLLFFSFFSLEIKTQAGFQAIIIRLF